MPGVDSFTDEHLQSLVHELLALPRETEWAEFKHNNANPPEIGETLSALSNSALLAGKQHGYLIWGVDDSTHEIVGTSFDPFSAKVGNEHLPNWIVHVMEPKLVVTFRSTLMNEKRVVLAEVEAAFRHPARFRKTDFIRVGSYTKSLSDHPEKERALWRALDESPFESGVAAGQLQEDDVLALLDTPAYFELLDRTFPESHREVFRALEHDKLIRRATGGTWDVTSLGAMMFARRLEDLPSLNRKALRVIQYRGTSRVDTIREHVGGRGYASGFAGLLDFLVGLLPTNEVIEKALRRAVPMLPMLAVREAVANALIHQDFFVTGAGPMVEIFEDRMEIGNPGAPLISPERFLDSAPRSRNEALASLARRMGICEERGSGVDKLVFQTELYQLPAPLFEATADSTRVVLLGDRPLTKMDPEDRVRACYLHGCLKYVNRDYVTNRSIRERFGLDFEEHGHRFTAAARGGRIRPAAALHRRRGAAIHEVRTVLGQIGPTTRRHLDRSPTSRRDHACVGRASRCCGVGFDNCGSLGRPGDLTDGCRLQADSFVDTARQPTKR